MKRLWNDSWVDVLPQERELVMRILHGLKEHIEHPATGLKLDIPRGTLDVQYGALTATLILNRYGVAVNMRDKGDNVLKISIGPSEENLESDILRRVRELFEIAEAKAKRLEQQDELTRQQANEARDRNFRLGIVSAFSRELDRD